MILYFSGTGNSAYVAKEIGKRLQDETVDLLDKIRSNDHSSLYSEQPWILVTPTYAWRIPRFLERWLKKTKLNGNKSIYFVMTCGGSIANANAYIQSLAKDMGMHLMGCTPIIMPDNYIVLFPSISQEKANEMVHQTTKPIEHIVHLIKHKEQTPIVKITTKDKIRSGIINDLFYPVIVHAKKFYARDICITCCKCVEVCPLNNIQLEHGKPVWKDNCTHCMSCICKCPVEAIEYGKRTMNKERYLCLKDPTS